MYQQRLLILSCSKAKRPTNLAVQAIDLYDGPAFRVLRRFISNSNISADLDILILSAKHGFLSSSTRIATYDQRMGSHTVLPPAKLRQQLTVFTFGKHYSEVFINLGSDYFSHLPDLTTVLDGPPCIITARGRIGERLHSLKEWLSNT
jgi:hypothetical protein